MNLVEVIGRMMIALGVVVAIMWVIAKWVRKPLVGKSDRVITVLARQQVSRGASVAVVQVADRALVIGVSEQGIRLLTETDLGAVEDRLQLVSEPARTVPALHVLPDTDDLHDDEPAIAAMAISPHAASGSRTIAFASTEPARPAAVATSHRAGSRRAGNSRRPVRTSMAPTRSGPLDGSILSPKVWKYLVQGARDLTVRR